MMKVTNMEKHINTVDTYFCLTFSSVENNNYCTYSELTKTKSERDLKVYSQQYVSSKRNIPITYLKYIIYISFHKHFAVARVSTKFDK